MANGFQHRQVCRRIGVRVALGEVVATLLGQGAHRIGLSRTVCIEQDLARVAAILDGDLRTDGDIRSQSSPDGSTTSVPRRR